MPTIITQPSPPRRRWFQFRLRTLLIAMTVSATLMAWLVNERNRIAMRRERLKTVEWLNVGAQPEWRLLFLGDDRPAYATGIAAYHLDDAALQHIKTLTQLKRASLGGTSVTDAGLANLSTLTNLEGLELLDNAATDAGLAHLNGMSRLEVLYLAGNGFGDDELVRLKGLTGLRWLYIDSRHISDTGLAHLRDLPHLEELFLREAKVTDGGVHDLQQVLPNLKVHRWRRSNAIEVPLISACQALQSGQGFPTGGWPKTGA